ARSEPGEALELTLGLARLRRAEDQHAALDARVGVALEGISLCLGAEDRDPEPGSILELGPRVGKPRSAELVRNRAGPFAPTPDQDRRVRLLERLGALTNALEADELALEGGVVRRPDRLHRKQRLAQEPEPSADGDPVMRELSLDPAGAHAEEEAPSREPVERRGLF